MTERLRPEDVAFLARERASAPMHNATVEIFEPAREGSDYETLLEFVADRIAFVPRYRQRILGVPGGVVRPVWVDDDDFDLTYHVRRSAVARPGTLTQLCELVARIVSRRLDRSRPLWELYVVEGLEDGRFALLTKSHQVLVDGVSTVDIGQVILDVDPRRREPIADGWTPERAPSTSVLVADALTGSLLHPREAVASALDSTQTVLRAAGGAGVKALSVAGAVVNQRRKPESPFTTELSQQRRFVTVRTRLEDYRKVRRFHGGTVNDVILATLTGALRAWLMTRGEAVGVSRHVRAMVPMSVIDSELEPTSLGSAVVGHPLILPIGESSPVVRLHQVSYAFKAHKETGRAVAADRLADVGGYAPTTFHALGARVAAASARRGFDLVVTNVPGPQFPLYAAGALLLESYPVPPLLPGHAMAIGVTSYDGDVSFGLTADFDAVPDVAVLATCLEEALEELVETTDPSRQRAPRGRARPDAAPESDRGRGRGRGRGQPRPPDLGRRGGV
jgi:diacylglycerol O-acyltransferase